MSKHLPIIFLSNDEDPANQKIMSVLQIKPLAAFKLLKEEENSILIDVRTIEELTSVGTIDIINISGRDNYYAVPWRVYPKMDYNPNFKDQLLKKLAENFGQNAKTAQIFFLCKVGGRSFEAANYMSNLGFENCFNIVGGFDAVANSYKELDKNKKR